MKWNRDNWVNQIAEIKFYSYSNWQSFLNGIDFGDFALCRYENTFILTKFDGKKINSFTHRKSVNTLVLSRRVSAVCFFFATVLKSFILMTIEMLDTVALKCYLTLRNGNKTQTHFIFFFEIFYLNIFQWSMCISTPSIESIHFFFFI